MFISRFVFGRFMRKEKAPQKGLTKQRLRFLIFEMLLKKKNLGL